MNIGWVSASPSATTGYGTQTLEICQRLMARHNVTCIGEVGNVVVWGGRQHIDLANGKQLTVVALAETQSAVDLLDKYYGPEFGLDIIVGFMDAFGVEFLNDINTPVVGWIPIDGYFTEKWKNYVRNYYKVYTYSHFGYKQLQDWLPPSKIGYIPHGISEEFNPPEDRGKLREDMGIPEDAFVIVNVGANIGPRKEIPLLMRTFARFAKKHDDAYLLLHTNPYMVFPKGYDLVTWRRMIGMEKHILFPRYDPIVSPASNSRLAEVYGLADVYVQNSVAEGFGLPIAEAMRCGIAPVIPDNSSQTELVQGEPPRGWLVDCIDDEDYIQIPVFVPMMTEYPVPSQKHLLQRLEEAYASPDERVKRGMAAREYIIKNHSWNIVMDAWFRVLDELEGELSIYKEIRMALK